MTNSEYLTALTRRFGLTETDVQMILISQGISGEEAAQVADVKLAIHAEFPRLIPMKNVSEGDYSESWNLEAVKLWYSLLSKELGLPDLIAEMHAPDDEVNDASFYS